MESIIQCGGWSKIFTLIIVNFGTLETGKPGELTSQMFLPAQDLVKAELL